MKNIYKLLSLTILLSSLSCSNNVKNQISKSYKTPIGVAKNFTFSYLDSLHLKVQISAPVNEDFSNQNFPYYNFPQGVYIELFDLQKNKTTVHSKYAIMYNNTGMVEFKDSVNVVTYDGKILKTNRLLWDSNKGWIFTPEKFTFINSQDNSITKGVGLDFNDQFSKLKAYKITGIIPFKE